MTVRVVRLPDVGEGVAEAELVSWQVAVGDAVQPESVLAEVLTDKATVEVYSPVAGRVAFLRGDVGDVLAVGGDFVGIEVDAAADLPSPAPPPPPPPDDEIRDVRTGTAHLPSPDPEPPPPH